MKQKDMLLTASKGGGEVVIRNKDTFRTLNLEWLWGYFCWEEKIAGESVFNFLSLFWPLLREIVEICFSSFLYFFESPPLKLSFFWHCLQQSICTKLHTGKAQTVIWRHSHFKSQVKKHRFSVVFQFREQLEKANINEPSHSEAFWLQQTNIGLSSTQHGSCTWLTEVVKILALCVPIFSMC